MKYSVGNSHIYDGFGNNIIYLTIRDVTMHIEEKDLIDLIKTAFKTKVGKTLLKEILKKYDNEKSRV